METRLGAKCSRWAVLYQVNTIYIAFFSVRHVNTHELYDQMQMLKDSTVTPSHSMRTAVSGDDKHKGLTGLFFFVGTGSHYVAWLALNSQFCLCFLGAAIACMDHHKVKTKCLHDKARISQLFRLAK